MADGIQRSVGPLATREFPSEDIHRVKPIDRDSGKSGGQFEEQLKQKQKDDKHDDGKDTDAALPRRQVETPDDGVILSTSARSALK